MINRLYIKFSIPHSVRIYCYCRPTMDLKIRVILSLVVLAIVVRDGKGKELTPDPLTGLSRATEMHVCKLFGETKT